IPHNTPTSCSLALRKSRDDRLLHQLTPQTRMSLPTRRWKYPRGLPTGDVFLKQWRIIVSTLHSRKTRIMFSQRLSILIILGSHVDKGRCVFPKKLTLHDALTYMYGHDFT